MDIGSVGFMQSAHDANKGKIVNMSGVISFGKEFIETEDNTIRFNVGKTYDIVWHYDTKEDMDAEFGVILRAISGDLVVLDKAELQ